MQASVNKEILPGDAAAIVAELLSAVSVIEAEMVTGVYVTGSVALDDFQSNKSDVDFVVLCKDLQTKRRQQQIKNLHKSINRKFKKIKLNGFYITIDSLEVNNSKTATTLYFEEGQCKSALALTPITLYELKTIAITVIGIPAEELPIVINQKDLDEFLFDNISTYWKEWVSRHSNSERILLLILFPRLTEWVILGLARQLYTLETGKIGSKTEAGYYCIRKLPSRYHQVLSEAISIRVDERRHFLNFKTSYYLQPSITRANKTIGCANYMIELFNAEYKEKNISFK